MKTITRPLTATSRLTGHRSGRSGTRAACEPTLDALLNLNEKRTLLRPLTHPKRCGLDEALRLVHLLLKKLEAETAAEMPAPRPGPLDRMKSILSANGNLRVGKGNLSGEKIARLYEVSLSQLAAWLGRSRQAMTKTPDADSIQNELGYFERIARLRVALTGDAEFRKWLRMSNAALGNETPLQWIERKQWQPLADLVDDLLTGAPG